MICLKRTYAKKNKKQKKKQNALYMIASMQACILGGVGVIGCTLKMIVPIK